MKTKFATVLFVLFTLPAFAGMQMTLTCDNPKCRFHTTCDCGGGFEFEQLSGYCLVCKKFVYVSWGRKQRPPAGLKAVWVPEEERLWKGNRNLFPCPRCKNYVFSISLDFKKQPFYCPKCFQHTLHAQPYMAYD